MTYDPDRDSKAPTEVNPNLRPGEGRQWSGSGVVFFLILIGVIGAGFIFFYAIGTSSKIDTTDLRPPITQTSPGTTGRGSRDQEDR